VAIAKCLNCARTDLHETSEFVTWHEFQNWNNKSRPRIELGVLMFFANVANAREHQSL